MDGANRELFSTSETGERGVSVRYVEEREERREVGRGGESSFAVMEQHLHSKRHLPAKKFCVNGSNSDRKPRWETRERTHASSKGRDGPVDSSLGRKLPSKGSNITTRSNSQRGREREEINTNLGWKLVRLPLLRSTLLESQRPTPSGQSSSDAKAKGGRKERTVQDLFL